MTQPEDNEREIERQKAIQRSINAYHRTFATEDGKAVLENLRNYFRMDRPAFERSVNHPFDPIAAAIRDGQREVLLFIDHKLAQPAVGDANSEKPKTTTIKP